MNEKIAAAVLTFLGLLVGPVVSHLLTRPMDAGTTVVWSVLVLSVTAVVFYILHEEKAVRAGTAGKAGVAKGPAPKRKAARAERAKPPTSASAAEAEAPVAASGADAQSVIVGFLLVLGGAFCWSISNVLLRFTARKLPSAGFDIALVNYLVASLSIIAVAWWLCRVDGVPFRAPGQRGVRFWLVAAAKGLNTYSWILAVTLISASAAAALEGLHVVFTVLLLALVFRVQVPRANWFTFAGSCLVLIVGTSLILGPPEIGTGSQAWLGVGLGVLSAFFFSVFYVLWDQISAKPASMGPRALDMGQMLLMSALCLFPIHVAVNAVWHQATLVPFASMSWGDIGLQALCGLVGIGGTYFLINESLYHMRQHRLCSLLLGIGLSYSIPFTMLLDRIFLGTELGLQQWLGGLLFAAAFAAIYRDMREKRLTRADMRTAVGQVS
jgi:drug/metabolite transporter (DMT)-like permease